MSERIGNQSASYIYFERTITAFTARVYKTTTKISTSYTLELTFGFLSRLQSEWMCMQWMQFFTRKMCTCFMEDKITSHAIINVTFIDRKDARLTSFSVRYFITLLLVKSHVMIWMAEMFYDSITYIFERLNIFILRFWFSFKFSSVP